MLLFLIYKNNYLLKSKISKRRIYKGKFSLYIGINKKRKEDKYSR